MNNGFFDFEIESDLAQRTDGITVFVSKDDDADIIKSTETLHQKVKEISMIEMNGYGHFTRKDMGTREFPELLDVLIERD